MSRREGRDSDSKRHRSRFDEEPRSRRDGRSATERPSSNLNLDGAEHSDRDQKHHHRLQDALLLEAPLTLNPKVATEPVSKGSYKKSNGRCEGTKHSCDPTEVHQSQSYFQRYDHGKDKQVGRSFHCRAAAERGWWKDAKNQQIDKATNRTSTDTQETEMKSRFRGDENRASRHYRYFETEADPKTTVRKRPSFQEKKITSRSENAGKTEELVKPSHPDCPLMGTERREERGDHKYHHLGWPEKPLAGSREANRGEVQRSNYSSRDRGAGGNYGGRERFTRRQGYRPSGVRVEKWKHDLFDEANRSPTPQTEEDQITKVEALLAL